VAVVARWVAALQGSISSTAVDVHVVVREMEGHGNDRT
jgi:hypothetical protein